jgi:hypothetical protein
MEATSMKNVIFSVVAVAAMVVGCGAAVDDPQPTPEPAGQSKEPTSQSGEALSCQPEGDQCGAFHFHIYNCCPGLTCTNNFPGYPICK